MRSEIIFFHTKQENAQHREHLIKHMFFHRFSTLEDTEIWRNDGPEADFFAFQFLIDFASHFIWILDPKSTQNGDQILSCLICFSSSCSSRLPGSSQNHLWITLGWLLDHMLMIWDLFLMIVDEFWITV